MPVLKTKNGKEIEVFGETVIDNKHYFISKVGSFYRNDTLIKYVLIPRSNFVIDVGEWVEEVKKDESVSTREVPEVDLSKIGEIQAEEST